MKTTTYAFLKTMACSFVLMLSVFSLSAQSVKGFGAPKNATIVIETNDNALLLQTDKTNRLFINYFGKRLSQMGEYAGIETQFRFTDDNAGIYNHAYTPSGSWSLVEPALRITHADGNTSTELLYDRHAVQKIDENVSITSVVLKDPAYPIEVT